MTQKIIKTGNSAAVTIPFEVMRALNLKIGDEAKAKTDFEKGAVTFTFLQIRQLRLGQSKKQVSSKRK